MKVVICGGGTGGHIYPALSIASRLRGDGHELLYMGAHNSTEEKLAAKSGFAFYGVEARGLHRRSLLVVGDLLTNLRGLNQARRKLEEYCPDMVIGTGGYASAPVIAAAQRLNIPTLLHEQNAFPGLANRNLARRAAAVCLTFAEAGKFFPARTPLHLTGLPVRREILECSREQALRYFGLEAAESERFTLLITGGSLGAASINRAALAAYRPLLDAGIRIIHICGEKNYAELKQQAPEHPLLLLVPYIYEMENALAVADLVVARAGASFLSESACRGLPTLLVPYPFAANDHQRYNARAFAEAGASIVIEDAALNGELLAQQVLDLAGDRNRLAEMSYRARSLGHPYSDKEIADIAYSVLNN